MPSIWVTPISNPAGIRSTGALAPSAVKISVALSAALGLLGHEIDPVGVAPREPLREADKASDKLKEFDCSASVGDKGLGAREGAAVAGWPVLGAAVDGCPVLGG